MIAVAGTWELGWQVPITESELWLMVLKEFKIHQLHMTPVTGIAKKWISEYSSFDELLSSLESFTPVFVDENGATELDDFDHPEDALYVFGKGTYSPFSHRATQHLSVRIGTPKPGCLWPHQALAIVLHDRERKKH